MLKILKWISAVSVIVLTLWLALLVNAVTGEPHKEASVVDGTGQMVVAGHRYVILTDDHWWRDAVGLFGPYLVALLVGALVFWYCSKRLRYLNPADSPLKN